MPTGNTCQKVHTFNGGLLDYWMWKENTDLDLDNIINSRSIKFPGCASVSISNFLFNFKFGIKSICTKCSETIFFVFFKNNFSIFFNNLFLLLIQWYRFQNSFLVFYRHRSSAVLIINSGLVNARTPAQHACAYVRGHSCIFTLICCNKKLHEGERTHSDRNARTYTHERVCACI